MAPREVILDCIRISQQAPTGSNSQGWRWVVVADRAKKQALADLYRSVATDYLTQAGERARTARPERAVAFIRVQRRRGVHPCSLARTEGLREGPSGG